MSENNSENKDSSLLVRRIILIIISLAVGWVGCFAAINFILDTTWADYGTIYIVMTILSIALGTAVWLDHEKVLNTKILPH